MYSIPPKLFKYAPFALAWMIFNIYIIFVIFVYIYESKKTPMQQLYLFGGSFSILILYWSLYVASSVDPGYVPQKLADEECLKEIEMQPRFCLTCNITKPERSHHCSKCRRCILNMDHHCLWTANCIGLMNRKAFNLVIIWGSVGMINATCLGISCIDQVYYDIKMNYEQDEYFSLFRCLFTMMVICTQFLNALALYHMCWTNMSYMFGNYTTLDQLQFQRQQYQHVILFQFNMIQGSMAVHQNEYNLGIIQNFRFYFGVSAWLWLLPVGVPLGDGYSWDKNQVSMINLELQI